MREIKRVENDAAFQIAYDIRVKVFVDEQNCPLELELDAYDQTAIHILVLDNQAPVGCGRVVFLDDCAKLGRIAVLKGSRGKGFGKMICEALIDIARAHGSKKAILDAQCTAIEFYEQLGFAAEGEIFDDAGIDHRRMVKTL